MPAGSAATPQRPSSGAGAACGAGPARHSGLSLRSWTASGLGSRAPRAPALCRRVMQARCAAPLCRRVVQPRYAGALCSAPVWPYLGSMGRILFLIIAALVAFMIVTWVVHALMFFFWIALVAVAGFGLLRLGRWSSARRSRG